MEVLLIKPNFLLAIVSAIILYGLSLPLVLGAQGDALKRADALRLQGKLKEAEAAYTNLINSNSNPIDSLNGRGRVRYQLKRYDAAISDFNKAIELDPNAPYCYYNRAYVYVLQGKRIEALSDLDRAVTLRPRSTQYRVYRSAILMGLRETERAIDDYLECIRQEPHSAEAISKDIYSWLNADNAAILSALGWLELDKPAKAIEDVENGRKKNRRNYHLLRVGSKAYHLAGNKKQGEQLDYEAALFGPPRAKGRLDADLIAADEQAINNILAKHEFIFHIKLAEIRNQEAFSILTNPKYKNDKAALEEAAAYAATSTKLGADSEPPCWFLRGLIYRQLSNFDEHALPLAEQMFENAVDLDPEHTGAWLELGLMMVVQERYIEAINCLEKALETDPAATAQYALGPLCAMYAASDQSLRGLSFFEDLSEANPEVPILGTGTALMLYCRGDLSAALSKLDELILLETAGSQNYKYLAALKDKWAKEKS